MRLLENYGPCRVIVGLGWCRRRIKAALSTPFLIESSRLHLPGNEVRLKPLLHLLTLVDFLARDSDLILCWVLGSLVMGEVRQVCHGEKLGLSEVFLKLWAKLGSSWAWTF